MKAHDLSGNQWDSGSFDEGYESVIILKLNALGIYTLTNVTRPYL